MVLTRWVARLRPAHSTWMVGELLLRRPPNMKGFDVWSGGETTNWDDAGFRKGVSVHRRASGLVGSESGEAGMLSRRGKPSTSLMHLKFDLVGARHRRWAEMAAQRCSLNRIDRRSNH